MKNIKIGLFTTLALFIFIGAGCTSVQETTNQSLTKIGDLYFELPSNEWYVQETESSKQVNLISPIESTTEITVLGINPNPVDVSGGSPSFTNDYADIYRDGCGGGWCVAYIINFHDGSQYDISFTGDPVSDEDIENILTSITK